MDHSDRQRRSSSPGAIRRGRARPHLATRRPFPPAAWGILLVAGGVLAWAAIPHHHTTLPAVWKVSAADTDAQSEMRSQIRQLGGDSSSLLRLEWPEHPRAVKYRIRFRTDDGTPSPAPLEIPSPVFLYDLHSNVLQLPRDFDWEVTAVLRDGSEIVSPWCHHPER
jgi:hypothetical protein